MAPREFRGRMLVVSTKRVRLPNGFVADIDIVRHPGAVLIVPLLPKHRVVLLRQYRPVIGKYLYELPAGTRQAPEPAKACARRELIEETGFAAKKITRLGEIVPVPGYSTEKIEIYKAEKLVKVPCKTEEDEVIRVMVMSRSRVRQLFRRGAIIDAKTICAFAMEGWL